MNRKLTAIAAVATAVLGATLAPAFASTPGTPTSANGVAPYIVANPGPGGNVTCAQLGYESSSARVDFNGTQANGAFPAGIHVSTNGTYVTWSSTFGIGAVIVKGGPAANIYEYDPQATGDSGLAAPPPPGAKKAMNASNPAGLSNLTFCWNAEEEEEWE
jgi:hypothetical protein